MGGGNNVPIFIGAAGATFTAKTPLSLPGGGNFTGDVGIGDFNDDGDEDLAVKFLPANAADPSIAIYTGASEATFTGPTTVNDINAVGLVVGDFDSNDDDDDLAVYNSGPAGPQPVQIWKGAAGATFTAGPTETVSDGFSQDIAIGDFDNGGADDLATVDLQGRVQILDGSGSGDFFAGGFANAGSVSVQIAVGDFNGDGDEDLAVTNAGSNNISILAGGTDATVSPVSLIPVPDANGIAVGDFNSDGERDLAVGATQAHTVELLLGGPGFEFTTATPIPIAGNPRSVTVGDFDGDGNQDLAVTRIGGGVDILTGGGPGWSSGNLLQFGGAEGVQADFNSTSVAPAPWSGTVGFVRYGSKLGPKYVTAQHWEGGSNFFSGGFVSRDATLTQTVDVGASAADIDAGRATANLSAMLGGFRGQTDAMSVTATFLDAAGASLGSFTIGPVTPADRGKRTLLLRRAQSQALPAATRSISVRLDATQQADDPTLRNYASADNVKLALEIASPPPAEPPPAGDTTPPETTIDKGPHKKTDATKAKIVYSANEPATFECKLKGASKKLRKFHACGDAKAKFKHLDRGKKKFQVRAIDAAGNVDLTPAKLKWKVLDE
jgi:hypothetical protein